MESTARDCYFPRYRQRCSTRAWPAYSPSTSAARQHWSGDWIEVPDLESAHQQGPPDGLERQSRTKAALKLELPNERPFSAYHRPSY